MHLWDILHALCKILTTYCHFQWHKKISRIEWATQMSNKSKNKPYLTLFHADISLAFSLSISSGSPVASLFESAACGNLRPKLPCRSRGCCLLSSTSSSCITPPMYCAALGETEFMLLRTQSWTLSLLIATQFWWVKEKTARDQVTYWLLESVPFLQSEHFACLLKLSITILTLILNLFYLIWFSSSS